MERCGGEEGRDGEGSGGEGGIERGVWSDMEGRDREGSVEGCGGRVERSVSDVRRGGEWRVGGWSLECEVI